MEEKKDKDKVILIKPYEISTIRMSMTTESSFIHNEIKNLEQHMKFIHSPSQTRLFKPFPHYQLLQSKGEQDSEFWKELTVAFINQKCNTETSQNGYPISMYQGGPPHESYFIAIDNRGQAIISPTKKIVATYVVRELEVLI